MTDNPKTKSQLRKELQEKLNRISFLRKDPKLTTEELYKAITALEEVEKNLTK